MENINDYNSTFFQDNPLENLNLAFDIAEKYLDIPRMLDPEGNITVSNFTSSPTRIYCVIIKW